MVRTRFAPSPTGYLHIGGLRTALYAYLFAKKNNGKFILRIEDTDQERYVEGATELIYSSLKDAGLIYDEGPDVGGDYGPYIQSERKHIYAEYSKKLVEAGGAYYCFCGKERLESLTDSFGNRKYDGHCLTLAKEEIEKKLADGKPYVIRQKMPRTGKSSYIDLVFGEISVDCEELEDNVLLKSDKMPTYNFANVIDDHLMRINYVIRGTEYLSSTPKYNLIYDSFGWERPQYIHLPPVMRDKEHKLSKRYGDKSYNDLVEEGFLGEALINYIALLGWSPKSNQEMFTFLELKELFSLEGISKSGSIFDRQKLCWLNGEYIKAMPFEEFFEYAKPHLKNFLFDKTEIAKLLQTRIEIFSQIAEKIEFFDKFLPFDAELFEKPKLKATKQSAKELLPKLLEISENHFENLHEKLTEFAAANNFKNGQVLWPLRIALTNCENTPGGAGEMALILGKEESLRRIKYSISCLE